MSRTHWLDDWIAGRCVLDGRERGGVLYEDFRHWFRALPRDGPNSSVVRYGVSYGPNDFLGAPDIAEFGTLLPRVAGITKRRSNGVWYIGISLRNSRNTSHDGAFSNPSGVGPVGTLLAGEKSSNSSAAGDLETWRAPVDRELLAAAIAQRYPGWTLARKRYDAEVIDLDALDKSR
ncbi:hypothetical protein QTI24_06605 [Variovorax sp. J22P240]|uniref:hypothetical protein n=1 Tax=Variovorax sp. J22P240 TaxID=3053514 RepID=UPI002578C34E|nr:hypothetical protein [Variovorax sp. J22P240]MDL9998266.1 hypothetical protein [Variovorax sp. J22P240]